MFHHPLYPEMQHDDDVVQKAIKDGAHTYLRKGGPWKNWSGQLNKRRGRHRSLSSLPAGQNTGTAGMRCQEDQRLSPSFGIFNGRTA